jgi:hypothetical protein
MADKGSTMKHYDELPDGTEPTVRRLPYGADQQGRHPEAAEPVTDVGQDEEDLGEDTTWFWVVIVVIFTAVVVAAALGGSV